MAKPNYTYLKRQKETAKAKKKAEKKQRKLDGSSEAEEHESLEALVEEVRNSLAAMDKESSLYKMGESLLENLPHQPEEVSSELARLFLERVDENA